jgi:hypothetical protein
MAKAVLTIDDVLDTAQGDRLFVCSAEPTTYLRSATASSLPISSRG